MNGFTQVSDVTSAQFTGVERLLTGVTEHVSPKHRGSSVDQLLDCQD